MYAIRAEVVFYAFEVCPFKSSSVDLYHFKSMAEDLQELLAFLSLESRLDLKSAALQYVLGLTVSEDGKRIIKSVPALLRYLFDLMMDKEPSISSTAHVSILNLSSDDGIRDLILSLDVIPRLLDLVMNPEWVDTDKVCMILSNLTHTEKGAKALSRSLQDDSNQTAHKHTLHKLVDIFDRNGFNKNADFHYLGTVFLNLSQVSTVRELFLDRKLCILPRLLPYIHFTGSNVRRGGVVGLFKNLCFRVGKVLLLCSIKLGLNHNHSLYL